MNCMKMPIWTLTVKSKEPDSSTIALPSEKLLNLLSVNRCYELFRYTAVIFMEACSGICMVNKQLNILDAGTLAQNSVGMYPETPIHTLLIISSHVDFPPYVNKYSHDMSNSIDPY